LVNSTNGVMKYAGKYVGKAQDSNGDDKGDWSHAGRWWGVINREALKSFVGGSALRVNREAWYMMRRLFRRVSPKAVQRSRTARGTRTWFTFDRSDCSNAWGGSFINQVIDYAIPGRRTFDGKGSVAIESYFF
jgi:hypothetical protein